MPPLAHTRLCVWVCVHALILQLSFRMFSRARQYIVAVVLYETVNVMTRRRLSAARLEMQIIFVASSPPGKSVLLWKSQCLEWWCPTLVSSAVVWVLSSGLASLAAEREVDSTREDSRIFCECWMIWISCMWHIVRSFPQHQLVFQFCHRGSFCQSNRSSCLCLMLARLRTCVRVCVCVCVCVISWQKRNADDVLCRWGCLGEADEPV